MIFHFSVARIALVTTVAQLATNSATDFPPVIGYLADIHAKCLSLYLGRTGARTRISETRITFACRIERVYSGISASGSRRAVDGAKVTSRD
jgi:hypothetical protein